MSRLLAKGTFLIMTSELFFILSNYLIHIFIARKLGVESYGIFGLLLSLFMINRAFLNTGVSRATSKFIAEDPNKSKIIFFASRTIQLWMAIGFMAMYIIFAPLLARLLQDVSLTYYIMFIGVMILPLAMLSLYTSGIMNGLRLFREQALIKGGYPLLRVLFTIVFILLGGGIFGALLAYFIAIILGLVWSIYLLREHMNSDKNEDNFFLRKKIFLFALPVAFSALCFSLFRNVNTLLIKSLLDDNVAVGLYTAANTISTIPYFILISLSLTLTPSISNATAKGNVVLVRKYITQSTRYILLLLVPGTLLLSATSGEVLRFFYSNSYVSAAPVLSVLAIGSAFLTLFTIFTSITTGGGKPWIEMSLNFFLILLLGVFNFVLIPMYGLIGSSYAVLLTAILAFGIIAFIVYKKYGTIGDIFSVMRIIGVSLVLYVIASWWQMSGWFLFVQYLVLGVFYVLLLYLFREFGQEDWDLVKRVFER